MMPATLPSLLVIFLPLRALRFAPLSTLSSCKSHQKRLIWVSLIPTHHLGLSSSSSQLWMRTFSPTNTRRAPTTALLHPLQVTRSSASTVSVALTLTRKRMTWRYKTPNHNHLFNSTTKFIFLSVQCLTQQYWCGAREGICLWFPAWMPLDGSCPWVPKPEEESCFVI